MLNSFNLYRCVNRLYRPNPNAISYCYRSGAEYSGYAYSKDEYRHER